MAIKITSTKVVDPDELFIKLCVFGESGIGKTVLCGTAPNPIIISAEKGLLSLAHLDLPVIEVTTKPEVDEAYQFLLGSNEAKQYQTICLDSISEISEICLVEKKEENSDGRQYWMNLAQEIATMIRNFRDDLRFHVAFTAKMERVKDDYTGVTTHKSFMPGRNLSIALPYFFDMLFAMRLGEMEDGTGSYRYIQPQPSVDYEAKDRSGALGNDEDMYNKERPDLTYIFDKIKRHVVQNPGALETAPNAVKTAAETPEFTANEEEAAAHAEIAADAPNTREFIETGDEDTDHGGVEEPED